MADKDQEKTEQKSQKKWEEARDMGELPRSQEISTFAVFTIVLVYIAIVRTKGFDAFGRIMADLLRFDRHLGLNAANLDDFLLTPFAHVALILCPFFLIVLFASGVINMGQTGFSIAKKKLEIDWKRLDPIRGLEKFKSLKQWVEGGKSALKIVIFAYLVYLTVRDSMAQIIEMPHHDLLWQLDFMVRLSLKIGIRIVILMALLSIADYLFQWWQFQEKLKMTPREVKDEMKEHEGDPLIRQRMRSIRMEMARKRMMNDVKHADMVVTNPVHYAVALRYDKQKMPAPYVCAKGRNYLAVRIREIALEHGVPVVENPPIARGLYKSVKVGQMIPADFFRAVAELMAFVFLLRNKPGASERLRRPLRPRIKAPLPAEPESPA